jgi:hypothetical protein
MARSGNSRGNGGPKMAIPRAHEYGRCAWRCYFVCCPGARHSTESVSGGTRKWRCLVNAPDPKPPSEGSDQRSGTGQRPRFCAQCGNRLDAGASFCARCGTAISQQQAPHRFRRRLVWLGAALVGLTVVAAVALAFHGGNGSDSDFLLVGEAQDVENNKWDLFLVTPGAELGRENRIARGVRPKYIEWASDVYEAKGQGAFLVALAGGDVGVMYLQEDDEAIAAVGMPSKWAETEQRLSSHDVVRAYYEFGTSSLMVQQRADDGSERCYLLGTGPSAEQVAVSDSECFASTLWDLVAEDETSGDATEYTFSSLADGLSSFTFPVLSFDYMGLSKDLVAFAEEREGKLEIVVVDWREGTEVARSAAYEDVHILDRSENAFVYAADLGQGPLDLLVLTARGDVVQVASAGTLGASLSEDGRWLVYLRDDGTTGETWELYVADLASAAVESTPLGIRGDIEGADGVEIDMVAGDGGEPLLWVWDRGDALGYGGVAGGDLEQVLDLASLRNAFTSPDDNAPRVYQSGRDGDGTVLATYDFSSGELLELRGNWFDAEWLMPGEFGVLARVQEEEDDEQSLVFLPFDGDGTAIEIDEADEIGYAGFSADGRTIWYTAIDGGDAAVRRADTEGNAVITAYEDATLYGISDEFGFVEMDLTATYRASNPDGLRFVQEAYGTPTVIGPALPAMPFEVASGDPGVGLRAPDIAGTGLDGSGITIDANGVPKAILFLTHWDGHSQAVVPSIQRWYDRTGGVEGVDLIAVSTAGEASRGNWPPSAWLAREGWTVPTVLDSEEADIFNSYGGTAFPYWVLLNGDGTIADRWAGEIEVQDLQQRLEALARVNPG